jgi:hypothetical protein
VTTALAETAATKRTTEHWLILFGSLGAVLLLAAFALWIDPDPRGYGTHEKLGLPPCAPMVWWNVPCPGCGVTTSFALAAHGELARSFLTQPLGCAIALAIPLAALVCIVGHLRGLDLRHELARRATWPWAAVVAVLVAGAWIYKLGLVRGWY